MAFEGLSSKLQEFTKSKRNAKRGKTCPTWCWRKLQNC